MNEPTCCTLPPEIELVRSSCAKEALQLAAVSVALGYTLMVAVLNPSAINIFLPVAFLLVLVGIYKTLVRKLSELERRSGLRSKSRFWGSCVRRPLLIGFFSLSAGESLHSLATQPTTSAIIKLACYLLAAAALQLKLRSDLVELAQVAAQIIEPPPEQQSKETS